MLEIRQLVKVFPGPVAALRGIDLDIGEGLFGLLGPNGAGKSTLMSIVTGALAPTSGSVRLDGHDIVVDPQHVRDRLGYLPQDFGLYPNLTGAQMLDLLLRLKGVGNLFTRRGIVDALLGQVNLRHAAKRRVSGYSGGMRQRLGIAQAIVGNPRLVVLDEPTAGLDPAERHRFYELLAELGRDRIVILSTHIVEDIATLCSRFAVIGTGTCRLTGPTGDARRALEGRVFEGVVTREEAAPILESHLVTQRLLVEATHLRLRVVSDPESAPAGFLAVPSNLEDAYFAALRRASTEAA